jgi:arylsulfatase A-like enzyme
MKKYITYILVTLFLVLFFASFIILIKPGASVFYRKIPVQTNELKQNGTSYEYSLAYPETKFTPGSVLFVQDKKPLELSQTNSLESGGFGTYFIDDSSPGLLIFKFIPRNNTQQINNNDLQIYIRPYPLSSNFGGAGVLLLTLSLFGFIFYYLSNPIKRQALSGSSNKALRLYGRWSEKAPWTNSLSEEKPAILFFKATIFTILAAYALAFMEWLFLITKPSFMEILSFGLKLKILLITGFIIAAIGMFALIAIFILERIFFRSIPAFRRYSYFFPAALIITCLCLLLVDNFTYTIIKFGIVDSRTLLRILYAIIFGGLFFYLLLRFSSIEIKPVKSEMKKATSILAFVLCLISFLLIIFSIQPKNPEQNQIAKSGDGLDSPNIILFGTDGLNAKNMSVYGYERQTTPFIEDLAKNSLVAENQFTNFARSLGSTVSILTGKLPFSTRVISYPDILRDNDSYQHLPGLFNRLGYRTISIGVPRYVDLNSINLQPPVDSVNCVETPKTGYSTFLSGRGFDDVIHFFNSVTERISERINHVLFIQDMQNPIEYVTENTAPRMDDQEKMNCLLLQLDDTAQTGQPLFAHVHLMGTHGDMFNPNSQVFSKGEEQNDKWMTDFYDDSILDYDQDVASLVQHLKFNNQYQDTVIILFSDHGQNWSFVNQIPLIIHFPNDEHAGIIPENTQNIDIAPTILDYLGIDTPSWMKGDSLLGKIDPFRLIIAGSENPDKSVGKPPFYQFGFMTAIQCQNYFYYEFSKLTLTKGVVENYNTPCPEKDLDSENIVLSKMNTLLQEFGYTSK